MFAWDLCHITFYLSNTSHWIFSRGVALCWSCRPDIRGAKEHLIPIASYPGSLGEGEEKSLGTRLLVPIDEVAAWRDLTDVIS